MCGSPGSQEQGIGDKGYEGKSTVHRTEYTHLRNIIAPDRLHYVRSKSHGNSVKNCCC